MNEAPAFERSVFINCPFDENFAPMLQALAFCVVDVGFVPRLAPENSDNAANRLDRIVELVAKSKFGIHDLSRCKASTEGEYARMNMPFELGIDHSCARFSTGLLNNKRILILEQSRYDYQKCLSDIAGWDIESHDGDYLKLIRKVRNWLVRQEGSHPIGAAQIGADYATFQEWYWERELSRGATENDILEYPTIDMILAMQDWYSAGKPDEWINA
jgi:hypothetical protein